MRKIAATVAASAVLAVPLVASSTPAHAAETGNRIHIVHPATGVSHGRAVRTRTFVGPGAFTRCANTWNAEFRASHKLRHWVAFRRCSLGWVSAAYVNGQHGERIYSKPTVGIYYTTTRPARYIHEIG